MVKTVDATGLVLGRMASRIAKVCLSGERVNIINCEKAVVSASKSKVNKVKKLRSMGTPMKGPFYPKKADRIVKRTIKGMLPHRTKRGREALKRLRCYISQPEEVDVKNLFSIPKASKDKIIAIKTIPVKKLAVK